MVVASALQYARNELEGYIPYVSSKAATGLGSLFTAYHVYTRGLTDSAALCGAVFTAATFYVRAKEEVTPLNSLEKAEQLSTSLMSSLTRGDYDSKALLFKTRFNSIREVLSQSQAAMPFGYYGECIAHLNGARDLIENAGKRLGFQIDVLSGDIERAATSGNLPLQKAAFLARYEKCVAAFALLSPADKDAMRAKGLKFNAIYNALNAPVALAAPASVAAATASAQALMQNPTQVKIVALHAEVAQSMRDGSFLGKQNDFGNRYAALHREVEGLAPQNRDPLRPKLTPIYEMLVAPASAAPLQARANATAAVSASPSNDPAEQLLTEVYQALSTGTINAAVFADRLANLPPQSNPDTLRAITDVLYTGPVPAPRATAQPLPSASLLGPLRAPSLPSQLAARPATAPTASAAAAAPALNLAAMPELIGLVRDLRAGTPITKQNYLNAFRQIMTGLGERNFCDGSGIPNPADFGDIFRKICAKIGLNNLHSDFAANPQQIDTALRFNQGADPQGRTLAAVIETGGHFSTWFYQNGNYYCAPEYAQLDSGEWLATREAEALSAAAFRQKPNGIYVCIYSKNPIAVPAANGVTAFPGKLPNINSCAIDASIQILARVLPENIK